MSDSDTKQTTHKTAVALIVGFVLGVTGSAFAQRATAWLEISQEPGSLWRATASPHIVEAVTVTDICPWVANVQVGK